MSSIIDGAFFFSCQPVAQQLPFITGALLRHITCMNELPTLPYTCDFQVPSDGLLPPLISLVWQNGTMVP